MTNELMIPTSSGALSTVPLGSLRLDPDNPRIPDSIKAETTAELATLLEMGFDAYPVAQSIAELGFFHAEPLIVVPHNSEADTWVVVEGNRRLTALLGLASAEIRSGFAEPDKWEALAAKRHLTMDMQIPVVIHSSRDTTHAEVARVHVVGKLPWRPYMQARYIAARVAEGRTIQQVADLIGITRSTAANLYRDQAVLAQAAEMGLETAQVERAFSLLTVAMGNTKIREHVGAPLGSRMEVDTQPIPVDKAEELREVIQWIFGDEEREAVISDSRQVTQLGNVIASPVGLEALRKGQTLEEAKQQVHAAGLEPIVSLTKRLTAAKNALASASSDIAEYALNVDIQGLVDDIESVVETIRATLEEVQSQSSGQP